MWSKEYKRHTRENRYTVAFKHPAVRLDRIRMKPGTTGFIVFSRGSIVSLTKERRSVQLPLFRL